jgi:endonuclease YncB( thermonuclease family)
MAKAIFELGNTGRTVGQAFLGRHGQGRASAKQAVHDGDTVTTEADGNISVRFLGIDTPEVSFTLPGSAAFLGIGGAQWAAFLNDPFAGASATFLTELGPSLEQHLRAATGPGCAANHAAHAAAAHRALEDMVEGDMQALGQTKEDFRFFLAFANEVMDGYGRMLCFLNRNQPDENTPAPRPDSYNERQLAQGQALPYFIWPNINPFRRAQSPDRAVPHPADIPAVATGQTALGPARASVQAARAGAVGVFAPADPLRLAPFELRFLASRTVPHRWVIDLTTTSNVLRKPINYHLIANPEDRLFVPAEYVPLFVEHGWQREL